MKGWPGGRTGARLGGRPGESPALVRTRRLASCLGAILLAAELIVAVRFSATTGFIMFVATAGLAGLACRGLAPLASAARGLEGDDEYAERLAIDKDTRLPNRNQLIDQLTRDIARSARYSQELTIAVVRISQYRQVRAAWGPDAGRQAALHVAESLRRAARASDFVARVDEQCFAVLLVQCNEQQGAAFCERLALAVGNRPLLQSATKLRVPLYVTVETSTQQFDGQRYRGPLDFLSVAGADILPEGDGRRPTAHGLAPEPAGLRRQLVRDYYPDGGMQDLAEAYREQRGRRHAG